LNPRELFLDFLPVLMAIPWKPDEVLPRVPGGLLRTELFWRDHSKWLEDSGYQLRARFQPSWVPSWVNTKQFCSDFEDSEFHMASHTLDAIQVSDGAYVLLKQLEHEIHPLEVEIGQYLSSAPLSASPDNHCIPVLDNITIPDVEGWSLLVMPLLRQFNDPRFENFGEAVDFFRQAFTGLRFMHQNYVAHRDINGNNIMMDASPMYPEPYHPVRLDMKRDWTGPVKHFTRTERPVKYYFIDFGLSRRYTAEDKDPREDIIIPGDKTVPEFQGPDEPCNPYHTDVYCMGNLVRTAFMQEMYGFDFIRPLVNDMVLKTPSARPTMDSVVTRFEEIVAKLPQDKLHSRIVYRDEFFLTIVFVNVEQWYRRMTQFLRGSLLPLRDRLLFRPRSS